MSDRQTVDFLASVRLLEGLDEADLAELARVTRRRMVREGQALWRQGEVGREVFFVVDGSVATSLRVPGDRTFGLRRRLASHLIARLRGQIRTLAVALSGESDDVPSQAAAPVAAALEQCRPPDSKYVRRMASFNDFDPLALWGFLTSGKYVRCPPGQTLVAEGTPSNDYYLTINGAVEKVLLRGDRRIRVGLAGPGMAFGYESLIDGLPSPVTAITRERALLLVIPNNVFDQLFYREDAVSRVFLEAIQRDLLVAVRQALSQWARLRASV